MRRKLFLLFALLTVFLNINNVKSAFHHALMGTLYHPFIYSRNLIILLTETEKTNTKLSVENQKLRESLAHLSNLDIDTLYSQKDFILGEILSYSPLGIPEELEVLLKGTPPSGNIQEATVVDLKGNLVGKVEKVNGNIAFIITIFSKKFKVGVESRNPFYTGVWEGNFEPIVRYVPFNAEVRTGDTLYTSSLSGFAKPMIPVGSVQKVMNDPLNPIFLQLKVVPFFKPLTSKKVIIYVQ